MNAGLFKSLIEDEFRSAVLSRNGEIRLDAYRSEPWALRNFKFKRKIIARVDQNNQHDGSENDADHYSDHTFQPGIARLHSMLQLDQLRIAVCPVQRLRRRGEAPCQTKLELTTISKKT